MGSSGTDWNGASRRGAIPNPLCGEPGCTETMLHKHIEPYSLTPTETAIADVHQMRPGDGEFYVDDWLWLKQYPLKAGERVDQHVHLFDHVTVIAVGTVRLTIDGVDQGEIVAPKPVTIRALAQHSMVALTDALIFCVHNLRGEGYPAIMEDV